MNIYGVFRKIACNVLATRKLKIHVTYFEYLSTLKMFLPLLVKTPACSPGRQASIYRFIIVEFENQANHPVKKATDVQFQLPVRPSSELDQLILISYRII